MGGNLGFRKQLDLFTEVTEILNMGRGRKNKAIKVKNRKRQRAKKLREKKKRESVRKSRHS